MRFKVANKVLESGSPEWLAARKMKLDPALMTSEARKNLEILPRNAKGDPIIIGGSDLGAALGFSKFKSNVDVWRNLAGITEPEDLSNNPAVKRGTMCEPFVYEMLKSDLADEHGTDTLRFGVDKHTYGVTGEPFVVNTDGWCKINDETWLIEIKTLNHRSIDTILDWEEGLIPADYEAQCRLYNHVFPNAKGVIICCAWGLDPDTRKHIYIPRDVAIENGLIAGAMQFVDSIVKGEEPEEEMLPDGKFDLPESTAQDIKALLLDLHGYKLGIEDIKEDLRKLADINEPLFDAGKKGSCTIGDTKVFFSKRLKKGKYTNYFSVKVGDEKSINIEV